MGEMDGVTMARALRKENETVQIIFVTPGEFQIQVPPTLPLLHQSPVQHREELVPVHRLHEIVHRYL